MSATSPIFASLPFCGNCLLVNFFRSQTCAPLHTIYVYALIKKAAGALAKQTNKLKWILLFGTLILQLGSAECFSQVCDVQCQQTRLNQFPIKATPKCVPIYIFSENIALLYHATLFYLLLF